MVILQKRSNSNQERKANASAIFESEGSTPRLRALLMERVSREVCLECGGRIGGGSSIFCASCLAPLPIVTDIGEAFDAWQWRVVQTKPAYMEGAFWAERVGVFERRSFRFIGMFDSLEEARQAAERNRERSLAASARYWEGE